MHNYLEYSREDLELIRRCAHLSKRSHSQNLRKEVRSKSIASNSKLESLEDTRKIEKALFSRGKLDDLSTKKKREATLPAPTLIQQVSQFIIAEQKNEESSILRPQNLKQKASQGKQDEVSTWRLQQRVLERIDQLKNRLEYRLYVNNRELMKRPAYGKYITCKYTEVRHE